MQRKLHSWMIHSLLALPSTLLGGCEGYMITS